MENNEYKISELIYKSISKTISEEERIELENWLAIPDNKVLYEKIINEDKIAQKIALYKNINIEEGFRKVEHHITKKPKTIRFPKILRYAAIFIGLLGLTYFYVQNTGNISNEKLDIVDAKILLQIDNETSKIVNIKGNKEFKNKAGRRIGFQDGNRLIYEEQNALNEIVFNTLVVPFGKKFELVLSDGTKVHLNAGTSLRYPSHFIKGANREVFLKGEAFFEVKHDKKQPFIVNTETLDVQVLGTKFNITAYPEEMTTHVLLVEGSVALDIQKNTVNNTSLKPTILEPNDMGSFIKNETEISLKKVNTNIHTSWINDELIFRAMTFEQIIKRLERNYNVTIKNKNSALGQEVFNASFKNQSIENILNYFNETHEIKYQIKNNEVIIL